MFAEWVAEQPRAWTRKSLLLLLSVSVHALVITGLIVVPLLRAESSLPQLRITKLLLAAAPATPGVPAAAARKRTSSRADHKRNAAPQAVRASGRLIAPVEVPETIPENTAVDFGLDEGSENGVEGGVEGGVDNGVLGGAETGGEALESQMAMRVTSVQRPRLIRQITPDYPQVALAARIQGVVVIEAVTDIYGRVKEARVISGNPLLNEAALAAVRKWLYEPYIVNGIPKPVIFTVTVTFNLQNK